MFSRSRFKNQNQTLFIMRSVWVVVVKIGVNMGMDYYSPCELMLMEKETFISAVKYKKRCEEARYYFICF